MISIKDKIISKLDIRAEALAMGIKLVGTVSDTGFLDCHDPFGVDDNASAGIHRQSGVFNSFRQDGYIKKSVSFFELCSQLYPGLQGKSVDEIKKHFADKVGVSISKISDSGSFDRLTESTVQYFCESIPDKFFVPLLVNRGLSSKTVQKYKFGYSKNRDRLTVPVYDEKGKLVNIRYHRVSSDQTPKTQNTKGHGKARLFGVNKLVSAEPGSTICITEGEFDSAVLEQETGFLSVSPTNGATAFQKKWVKFFHGMHVVICWDCDKPGRQAVKDIVLPAFRDDLKSGKVPSLRVVWIFDDPGDKYHKDITDYVKTEGASKAALINMIEQAEMVNPDEIEIQQETAVSNSDSPIDPAIFFDDGNFKPALLVDYFLEDNEIFHDGGNFYIYKTEKGIWEKVHDNYIGKIFTKALINKAKRTYIQDALKILEYQTYKNPDEVKPDSNFINLRNGMLDIRNRKLLLHNKKFFSRSQIPIKYEPDAECSRFDQFLEEVFKDDAEKSKTLQEFSGYCLYPGIFIHKCLFLIGSGSNGKSIFLNTLCKIVGFDNVSAIELYQFDKQFIIGTLRDKLLNCCSEIETQKKVNTGVFKQAVGGDLIQGDAKNKPPFTFRPIAKHIFSMNEIPTITDKTHGFARRLIVVTFNQRFEGENADPLLEQKIESELPGILNWALEGLSQVISNNSITVTEGMKRDKENFLTTLDPVRLFVEEQCVLKDNYEIHKGALYDAYKSFCESSNLRPKGKGKFYAHLYECCPSVDEYRPEGRARYFTGIKIITEEDVTWNKE